MQCAHARLKSFTQRTRAWPHPPNFRAVPLNLADAGFYWKPASSSPDNVVCFLCEKSLDGWVETDDPYDEHFSHARRCGWAILKLITVVGNQLPFHWDDPDQLPKGDRMTKARLQTFGSWWPHENDKTLTMAKMANAGFYYAPTKDIDDLVQCPYCDLSLDSWETTDDPVHEHQRRNPTCPFFATRAAAPTLSSAAKAVKGKRKEPSRLDFQAQNEQALLLSPRSQRVHGPSLETFDPRRMSRMNHVLQSPPPPSPLFVHSGRQGPPTPTPFSSPPPIHPTPTIMKSTMRPEGKSSSSPRSVDFTLPASTTKTTRDNQKLTLQMPTITKSAIETRETSSAPRRQSMRLFPGQRNVLDNTPETPIANEADQKRSCRDAQDSIDNTPASSSSRFSYLSRHSKSSSNVSVIIKKQKLTADEEAYNRATWQDVTDDESDRFMDQSPLMPASPIVEPTKAPRKRRTIKKANAMDVDESSVADLPSSVKRKPGRPPKIKVEEDESTLLVRPKKKAPMRKSTRSALTSRSGAKSSSRKKPPKAMIEIIPLPDEADDSPGNTRASNQTEDDLLAQSSHRTPSPQPTSSTVHDQEEYPGHWDAIESAVDKTPPPKGLVDLPGLAPEVTGGFASVPIAPVKKKSESLLDIENATVVVVDPETPIRRAASSLDFEGWEDEDRQESTQESTNRFRLSSPLISPSQWAMDGTLSTSTPKPRATPVHHGITSVHLGITPRKRYKDVLGSVKYITSKKAGQFDDLHVSDLGTPPTKKSSRIHIPPEMEQSRLVDQLKNLMQANATSEVMAVAEQALKDEVKQLRKSQNKERRLAAAAAIESAVLDDHAQENVPGEKYEEKRLDDNPFQTPTKPTKARNLLSQPLTPMANRTPLPISKIISAIGDASRQANRGTAMPFVRTPVRKSIDVLRLEDLEVEEPPLFEGHENDQARPKDDTSKTMDAESLSFQKSGLDQDGGREDRWVRERKQPLPLAAPLATSSRARVAPSGDENVYEGTGRAALLAKARMTEKELRMTVEEFHRAVVEEQVAAFELEAEALVQRFEQESRRVRRALLGNDTSL